MCRPSGQVEAERAPRVAAAIAGKRLGWLGRNRDGGARTRGGSGAEVGGASAFAVDADAPTAAEGGGWCRRERRDRDAGSGRRRGGGAAAIQPAEAGRRRILLIVPEVALLRPPAASVEGVSAARPWDHDPPFPHRRGPFQLPPLASSCAAGARSGWWVARTTSVSGPSTRAGPGEGPGPPPKDGARTGWRRGTLRSAPPLPRPSKEGGDPLWFRRDRRKDYGAAVTRTPEVGPRPPPNAQETPLALCPVRTWWGVGKESREWEGSLRFFPQRKRTGSWVSRRLCQGRPGERGTFLTGPEPSGAPFTSSGQPQLWNGSGVLWIPTPQKWEKVLPFVVDI